MLSFCLQCVIDNQALPCLLNLLTTNHKKSIKKEACWTISNITAGNREQIQVCVLELCIYELSIRKVKQLNKNILYHVIDEYELECCLTINFLCCHSAVSTMSSVSC
jgi:hypothetical protein